MKSVADAMTDEASTYTDVVYLFAHMWLRMLRIDVDIQGAGKVAWSFGKPFQKSDTDWQALVTSTYELKHGYLILKRWMLSRNVSQDSDIFERDYQYLLEEMNLLHGLMEGVTNRRALEASGKALEASEKSIEESKRGIEEAHMVGRLTQLAFIFLPLTFVTGVFGMNITAFGGGAPMWKFWVTLATVSVPSFIFGLRTARRQLKPIWTESFFGSSLQSQWEHSLLKPIIPAIWKRLGPWISVCVSLITLFIPATLIAISNGVINAASLCLQLGKLYLQGMGCLTKVTDPYE